MKIPYIEDKIKTLDELLPIVQELKAQNKVIVTNNGSYDILHIGHVTGLFVSKEQGDVLIIGLNSDKSIKEYKSKDRPINNQEMRARMLAALPCVDYIFIFDETTPHNFIEKIKPHIHTNGAEYGTECVEKDAVEENGGKIFLLPMVEGFKTTSIIEKITQVYCKKQGEQK